VLTISRNNGVAAVGDACGTLQFQGPRGASIQTYGLIRQLVSNATAAHQGEMEFATPVAGNVGVRVRIGAGLYTAGAADRGSNTVSSGAFYDDGALLCAPIEDVLHGSFDPEEWRWFAPYSGIDTYLGMKADGYDPSSAESFVYEMEQREALPGYWSPSEWAAAREAGQPSLAERHERALLTMDLMALAIRDLTKRVAELETKLKESG
jgi:hypothetical protein